MRSSYNVILSLFISLIFLSGNLTQAQVIVDNITTRTGDATSSSFTHQVSGSERLLIVGISLESGDNTKRVSNVTYNGQNLTRVGEIVNSGGDPRADVWMLVDPPSGSNTVTVTLQQQNKFVIGAISFSGVDQNEAVNSIVTGQGQNSPSLTVSSSTGDLVMDVVASLKAPSLFNVGPGQTQLWKIDINNGSSKTGAASTEPGDSSVTMSWSGSEKWAAVAFNIQRALYFGDFRSIISGDWQSVNTWEVSTDGGNTWNTASTIPFKNNVTIRNGHIVNITNETVVNNLIVESGGTLIAEANIIFNEMFTLNGTFEAGSYTHSFKSSIENTGSFDAGTSTFTANGSGLQTISGADFNNLNVNNNEAISLLSDISVSGTLTFINGNLYTGENTLTLGPSGSVTGEANGSYVVGKLSVTRNVNAAEEIFGSIGVIINPGSENLGNTEVFRTSGPDGIIEVNGNQGIARKWNISPDFNPIDDVLVTFNWVTDDNNSLNNSEDYMVYTSPDGNEPWNEIAPIASGTGTVTFNASEFSAFTVGDINTPLPVELTSFTAVFTDGVVKLNWTTASEINNYGFEVERMYNNGNWEKIGFAAGSGTSTVTRQYSYNDNKTVNGIYSYRLKQIDMNGSYEYFGPLQVMVHNIPASYSLMNYPNPFNPTTNIIFELPKASNVVISVYNILGQKVQEFVYGLMEAGVHTQIFNGANLSSGTYIYMLEADNVKLTKTFTLIK